MKRLPLVVIAVLVLALGVIGCARTPAPSPQPPPTPGHTQNQVIAIAQAQYPVGFKQEDIGRDASGFYRSQTVQTPTSIAVRFIGGSRAAWEVTIRLPIGYRYSDFSYGTKILYFYEDTSSLESPPSAFSQPSPTPSPPPTPSTPSTPPKPKGEVIQAVIDYTVDYVKWAPAASLVNASWDAQYESDSVWIVWGDVVIGGIHSLTKWRYDHGIITFISRTEY